MARNMGVELRKQLLLLALAERWKCVRIVRERNGRMRYWFGSQCVTFGGTMLQFDEGARSRTFPVPELGADPQRGLVAAREFIASVINENIA